MADIFLSYSRRDLARVQPIVERLEREGYDVWWDREMPAGTHYPQKIETMLEGSRAVLVAWSHDSRNSPWVYEEAGIGLEHGKLVQIRLDEVAPPLGGFRSIHIADFLDRPPSETAWSQLDLGLQEIYGGGAAKTAAAPGKRTLPNPVLRGADTLVTLLALVIAGVFGLLAWLAIQGGIDAQTMQFALLSLVVLSLIAGGVVMSRMLAIARAGG